MSNPQWSAPVIDCDGHLVESIPEMAEYLDPIARKMATNPGTQPLRRLPRAGRHPLPPRGRDPGRAEGEGPLLRHGQRVTAKAPARTSSPSRRRQGWRASVLFASEALSVSFVQQSGLPPCASAAATTTTWPTAIAASATRSTRMGIIPMQNANEAVLELRRARVGPRPAGRHAALARLPACTSDTTTTGRFTRRRAASGAVMGIHGGSSIGFGIDTFTSPWAARSVRHPRAPAPRDGLVHRPRRARPLPRTSRSASSKAEPHGPPSCSTAWSATTTSTPPAREIRGTSAPTSRAATCSSAARATRTSSPTSRTGSA